ncbi:wax ester/triacylglycerol synthase family O-acyltransferase [Conexibacter sp. DBS9H8]|uniref:WS/DGAT/MGAT family O-acyltransferase n=1 Tax=Conexibacter sp. DBS9H8 TaxID=2937801 RepID=UPI00200FCE47|nr:wax ester/triacylglycerol synthase family O-acyltransferase [Conexibacter sp. DBS9H8]
MRQLTALDQQFLALEDSRHVGHVGGLAILDPSTAPGGELALSSLQSLIAERLHTVPPLRWRLAEVPFDLDYDYWIDDPDFDIDFHVRELGLAPPGTEAQLSEQVARIFARPLDRARPLWELYLIHGLPDGRVAVMTKIHHAMIDGMSGAEIMGVLYDLDRTGRQMEPSPALVPAPARAPGELEMLMHGMAGLPRYPLRMFGSVRRALPDIAEVPSLAGIPGVRLAGRVAGTTQRLLGRRSRVIGDTGLVPPRTSFNGRVSAHRRFVFGQLSLAEIKQIKGAWGCTVNDVVVSICAGAVRRWLLTHDELPDEPLVAQIPVSVRTPEQRGTFGNRILLMTAPLFTNEADPVRRLALTHDALALMKERHQALPANLLQDANQFIPPAVFSRAARLSLAISSSKRGRPSWNLVISNVPGPQVPIYLAGARLEANFPLSVITDGMGLNITVMSYCGRMDFGIVADRDQMPDVADLIVHLQREVDVLRETPAVAVG